MEYTKATAKEWAKGVFHGVCNVIIPSYTADLKRLNEKAIRHDVRRNIELGFWGALLVSEAGTTMAEMKQFMEIAVDEARGRHRFLLHGTFDTADDIVQISRKAAGILIGQGSEMLKYHMEIRGLGIIDVRSIFGIRATRPQKRIEVEIHLEEWDNTEDYERIGVDENYTKILEVEIPFVKLPIFPGKNITVIAEVVAMSQLLKVAGVNMARDFDERLRRKIQAGADDHFDMERYLERDFE